VKVGNVTILLYCEEKR